MSSPQLENGYTRIANELLEEIISFGFSKRQFAVVLAVIRRTYGYNKKADQLSGIQIANMTGIPRNHVAATIVELASMGVVLKQDSKYGNTLSINKNYGQWGSPKTGHHSPKTGHVPKQDSTSPKTGLQLVPKQDTQKTNIKTNKKQDRAFDEFWQAYPRKQSKGAARRWWNRKRPNEQLQAAIMAGLERAKTSEQWTADGGKYIPHPSSWLNNDGWEDEVTPTEPEVHAR